MTSLVAFARRHGGELVRFLAVGGLSALVNTLIVVMFTELVGLPHLVSYWACFVVVNLWGFALNRSWSFRAQDGAVGRQGWRYFVIVMTGTVLAFVAIRVMVPRGVPYWLANFLAAGLIAPFNFVAHRWWSFGSA